MSSSSQFLSAICTTALLCNIAIARADIAVSTAKLDEERIYLDDTWLALLHYQNDGTHWRSETTRAQFFLTEKGFSDPRAELVALIDAISKQPGDAGDTSVACRFPARVAWLRTRFSLEIPAYSCPALEEWKSRLPTERMSIVFASSYMSSPASMFGHTFLRFKSADLSDRDLVSSTVNFTADDSASDNPLEYMWDGVFGGFAGRFDNQAMFRRLRTYSENEGRDLWEYDLNFSPQEIAFVIDHAWEIREQAFDYLFFSENCGYRTLSVLAIVKPKVIRLDDFRRLAIPIDTVRALDTAGLITASHYWPSAFNSFRTTVQQLSRRERRMTRALANGKTTTSDGEYSNLPLDERARILDMAMQYLSLRIQREEEDATSSGQRFFDLLHEKARLNLQSTPVATDREASDPLNGHKHHRATYRIGRAGSESYGELGIRLAGHDTLDPPGGQQRNSSIEFIGVRLRTGEASRLSLEKFDFVAGSSLEPSTTFFPHFSWNFNASFGAKDIVTNRDRAGELGFGLGLTQQLGGHLISIIPNFSADSSHALPHAVDIDSGIELALLKQSSHFSYRAAVAYRDYLTAEIPYRTSGSLEAAYFIGTNGALQISIARNRFNGILQTEGSVAYRHYF